MKSISSKLFLCLIVFLAIAQISCDAWAQIKGQVCDSQNNPIENATVQLKIAGSKENFAQRTVKTDKNGRFELNVGIGPFNDDLRLIAAKDGYKIYETTFSSREYQKNESQFNDYKIVLDKNE